MIERRFGDLWQQLQGKKPHLPHFLAEIHLQGIRGIDDLRVVLDYPVSVIAGGNASGKSTVLFAAACAYRVPGAGVKDFVPSTLFPDYRPDTAYARTRNAKSLSSSTTPRRRELHTLLRKWQERSAPYAWSATRQARALFPHDL